MATVKPPAEQSEAPENKAPQSVRINVGPEPHVWGGKRFGPGIITLEPSDPFFTSEEGEFNEKKFNKLKRDLIASTQRVHAANNKRLGLMAHELGPNANQENLRPPTIHERLPDVTGEIENPNAAPVSQIFE